MWSKTPRYHVPPSSGLLRPDTTRVLMSHRPAYPLFTPSEAEVFYEKHTIGDLKVHPTTDGKFIVFDYSKPFPSNLVAGPFRSLEQAHSAMVRLSMEHTLAASEPVPLGQMGRAAPEGLPTSQTAVPTAQASAADQTALQMRLRPVATQSGMVQQTLGRSARGNQEQSELESDGERK